MKAKACPAEEPPSAPGDAIACISAATHVLPWSNRLRSERRRARRSRRWRDTSKRATPPLHGWGMALASELVWVSSCTRRPSFFPCPTGSDTQRHSLRPTLWARYTIRSGGCPPASTLGRARSTRGGCSPRRRTRHSEVSPRSPWVPLGWSKSVRHLSTARTEVRTAARLSALPPAVNKDTTGERQEQGTVSCRRRGDGRLRVEHSRADQMWLERIY